MGPQRRCRRAPAVDLAVDTVRPSHAPQVLRPKLDEPVPRRPTGRLGGGPTPRCAGRRQHLRNVVKARARPPSPWPRGPPSRYGAVRASGPGLGGPVFGLPLFICIRSSMAARQLGLHPPLRRWISCLCTIYRAASLFPASPNWPIDVYIAAVLTSFPHLLPIITYLVIIWCVLSVGESRHGELNPAAVSAQSLN